MAEPMVKIYSHSQFNQLLAVFQNAIDCGEYTEKIPYDTWRKLKKMSGDVKVEYCSPFMKIAYLAYTSCGEEVETVVFSAKIYNNGFGRFLYDNYFNEEVKNNMSSISATNKRVSNISATTATNTTADTTLNGYINSSTTSSIKVDSYGNAHWSDRTGDDGTYATTNSVVNSCDICYHKNKCDSCYYTKKANENKNDEGEKTKMKGINFDFGPCGNTVRLSMYGMAIQNVAGEWVSYNPDSREIINVDVFNIADGGKYMYKIPVAISDVKIGDIVIHNRVPMFVTAINENGTFEVTDVRAGEAKTVIPTRSPFGFNFMTKIVSLFDAFTDAPTADQPFGNMLPFLMMDDNKDIDPMMMFMMMNQSGSNMLSNPMMIYFLMKDNKDFGPMLMFMMMNQNTVCGCSKNTEKTTTQV